MRVPFSEQPEQNDVWITVQIRIELGELFRLLGDSVRARVISALTATDELCVGDIAIAIGARENAVSYALRQLRSAGLVERRRRGREIYYKLADRRPADLLALARRPAP
jgi:DNA-binding transcriptional ArsR family regulator